MNESDDEKELLKDLDKAETEASDLQRDALEVAQTARIQRDLAQAVRETVLEARAAGSPLPPANVTSLRLAWGNHNDLAQKANASIRLMTYGIASGANIAVSTSASTMSFPVFPNTGASETLLGPQIQRFKKFLAPYAVVPDVEQLLIAFGLNADTETGKSALTLLREASKTLTTSDEPTGALIQLRECINAAVACLLRRRPQQEEAKPVKAKIISLGAQCGRDGLPETFFVPIGDEFHARLDALSSGGKQKLLNRSEVMTLFNVSLSLLRTLLESLDPAKLRSS